MTETTIAAIEAGGTKFVAALASQQGEILARARFDTRTPAEVFPELVAFFTEAAQTHGPIAGVGVASFGPLGIDPAAPDYGQFLNTPKPGWKGASWLDALTPLAAPVMVDTDVNGAAIGEWLAGAGRGCRTLAYTTVGTGIGTGVLEGGVARSGISHLETGHVRPPRAPGDSFAGTCPYHHDCLEGLASGPAIKARWGTSLDQLGEVERDTVADYLAHFATTLVLTHMPERLVFGGGVLHAPGLLDKVRAKTEAFLAGYVAHPALDEGLKTYITLPGLGDDAGITGAIELGRRAAAAAQDKR